jgi:putative dehydrogenase
VPEMFDKAYRFVGEMEEIADFVGEDPQAKQMYLAFADFYRRIAADVEGQRQEADALAAFLKPKQ